MKKHIYGTLATLALIFGVFGLIETAIYLVPAFLALFYIFARAVVKEMEKENKIVHH